MPTDSVGNLCAQPVDKHLHALRHKRVKRIGEKFAKENSLDLSGEKFATLVKAHPEIALPTISVGKLCAQPVDKRLRALRRKRVKHVG